MKNFLYSIEPLFWGALLGLLPGCPWTAPTPPTSSACVQAPASDNCGLCASRPVCGWCASDDDDRGCRALDSAADSCSGTWITVTEDCETVPENQVER
jgi:hypothetical protein